MSGEPQLVFSPLYFLPEESQLLSKLSGDRVVYNTTRKIVVQASSVCNPRTAHKNKKDLLRRHARVLQSVSHPLATRGGGEAGLGERVGGELRDGEELVLGDESLGAAVGDFTWRGVLD